MKNLPLKIILLLAALFMVGLLSGCSVTDEKDLEEIEGATEAAQAAVKEKAEESKVSAMEAEPEAAKEESVSEVMPETTKSSEPPKDEPISEPAATDKKVEETPAEISSEQKPSETESAAAVSIATQEPPAPKQDVPVSTGPDHFVVTAGIKDKSHPLFGKGHKMGFAVNNEQGKEIVLERGKTYRFDIATDPMHDVYISLKQIGWGSVPYSKGIEGMYTYKGTMTVKPDKTTPDLLFYSCRNHPYMGGKIHIVNPGEKVKLAKRTEKSATPVSSAKKAVSKADVNQKIMFANMLMSSKNTKSIMNSNISEAVEIYKKAEKALESAKSQLKDGSNDEAYKNAENAIALLKKSSKLVPNESQLALMKDRNKELLASLKDFEDSHKENYARIAKKQGKEAAADYDKSKVASLKSSASDLVKKGDYGKANKNLEQAQRLVTTAIHKMLDKQTIVYDLKFESAEEEYEYELKRFEGYAELIPIAVEQKKPAEGAKKLMESFVDKGKKLRDRAKTKAKEGDFPTAIAMMQDATKDVRRGLRMIGVSQ
jgi:HEPN domain-containing protein